jgi:hypothetical protein
MDQRPLVDSRERPASTAIRIVTSHTKVTPVWIAVDNDEQGGTMQYGIEFIVAAGLFGHWLLGMMV